MRRGQNQKVSFLTLIALILSALLGFYLDQMDFLALSFFSLFSFALIIWILPINWSLIATFIYIGFEGFLKVISNYNPIVHVGADILIFVIYLKLLFEVLISKRNWTSEKAPYSWLFIIHFCWLFIVLFHPYSIGFIPSIAGSKVYAIMVSLYFLAYYFCDDPKEIRKFMWTFIIISVIHSLVSIYQIALGPVSVTSLHPRYAVQLLKYKNYAFRPFGLTNLPGAPAVYMYPVIPFLFYLIYHYKSWLSKIIIFSFLPISTYVFLHCQVRSAIAKALFGFSFFIIGLFFSVNSSKDKIKRFLIFNSIFLIIAFTFAVPKLMSSDFLESEEADRAYSRSLSLFDYNTIKQARRGTLDRFLLYAEKVPFGAGFSRVGGAASTFQKYAEKDPYFGYGYFFTDNFWIACLVEIGFPGMILMTALVFLILATGFKLWWKNRDNPNSVMQLTLLASLLSIILGLYGAEGILYNPDSCFFWFFSGALMASKKWKKTQV